MQKSEINVNLPFEKFDGIKPDSFDIRIKCYGTRAAARSASIHIGNQKIKSRLRFKPYLAILDHANEELNFQVDCSNFSLPNHSLFKRLLKVVSLFGSGVGLFNGVLNGYELHFEIENYDYSGPLKLQGLGSMVWVTRSVGRLGFQMHYLDHRLEYMYRRGEIRTSLTATRAGSLPTSMKKNRFWIAEKRLRKRLDESVDCSEEFQQSVLNLFPKSSYAKTFLALANKMQTNYELSNVFQLYQPLASKFFSEDCIQLSEVKLLDKTNVSNRQSRFHIFQARNVKIRNGKNLIVGNFLIDQDVRDFPQKYAGIPWPTLRWSGVNSEIVATPTVEESKALNTDIAFFPANSNIAHFFDDHLAGLYKILEQEPVDRILFGDFLDSMEMECLESLSSAKSIRAGHYQSVDCSNLFFYIFLNKRNAVIDGINSEIIIEVETMQSMLSELSKATSTEAPKLVYIKRSNKLFRRLINKRRLEKMLSEFQFSVVDPTLLSLSERNQIFSSAEIIVSEVNAALANAYFCNHAPKVVQLCHPDLANSLEHLGLVELKGVKWFQVVGSRINLLNKIIYGVDAYKINIGELRLVLNQITSTL